MGLGKATLVDPTALNIGLEKHQTERDKENEPIQERLKAVDDLAIRYKIPHWISLENRMACAVGACRSCVVPVRDEGNSKMDTGTNIRYKTVCHDGPVFKADEIIWEHIPEP